MSITLNDQFKNFVSQRVLGVSMQGVNAVLALHGEGATVPFIARYRKEKTGNLSEVDIRGIISAHDDFLEVSKRKQFVLEEISKQGNLTDDLRRQLETSWELGAIEEIYRPFKKKKKTKATLAREAGLGPLADWLWSVGHGELSDLTTPEVKAKEFMNPGKGYTTYDEVLRGAQHIIIEKIANNPDLRSLVKDEFNKNGKVVSVKAPEYKTHSKYQMYSDFHESVRSLGQKKASHRYLALRRGWQEGELKVTLEVDEGHLLGLFEAHACNQPQSVSCLLLKEAAKHALTVHVIPSITNEIHQRLKETADEDAIAVFADNVRRVLMASPFGAKVVLGVDPGIRTGCKLALVDRSGHFISNTVLHIEGESAREKAKSLFSEALKQIKIDAIAVGNGTGGREAEVFIRGVLKEIGHEKLAVVMVSEAGASVYSASDVAREEFPELDVTVRGAISISRRLQDPLAELVKIEPKSIGVGQYQHDVSQNKLKKSLSDVVESCVNQVGVDVNTASASLLQYVSGIGPAIARNILNFRKQHGLFKERSELLKVPQFSAKVFEQSAGFLRIPDGKLILDRTGIHPERYSAVREMAQEAGSPIANLLGEGSKQLLKVKEKWSQLIGEFTFDDIIRELEKPGRDPRDLFKVFQYREDIHELKDLKPGMICPGLVTNVTNFGAFVDIGVHQDGLVHISELSDQFVEDPSRVVKPGDQVTVRVLAVDLDKTQIALSMKSEVSVTELKAREPRAPRPKFNSGKPNAGDRQTPQGRSPRTANINKDLKTSGGVSPTRNRPKSPMDQTQKNAVAKRGTDSKPPGKNSPPSNLSKSRGQPFNNPFASLTNLKNQN